MLITEGHRHSGRPGGATQPLYSCAQINTAQYLGGAGRVGHLAAHSHRGPQGTRHHPIPASHKLGEVVHRGDEALPLAGLVGVRGLGWGLRRGFGMARGVHQGQAGV